MDDVVRLVLYIAVLGYSCILHECAHVWVALKLGDPTGKMEGRLTLNPIPHVDFFWTLLLPTLTYLFSGMPFGGPKPAPVNPANFRDPRSGFMWTAVAGPATNFLLSALGLGLMTLFFSVAPEFLFSIEDGRMTLTVNSLFFANLIFTNLLLGAFNLIPVPPLDGSRFLRFILGRSGEGVVDWIERLGFIPLFLVVYFLAPHVLGPIVGAFVDLLAILFGRQYSAELAVTFFRPIL